MSSESNSTSSTLSDFDSQVLYFFGLDIIQDALGVIWETLFISAYGIFFGIAVYSIFRKGFKSRSSVAMLCVVVYLYASSLTLWALNVTAFFKTAHAMFIDYPDMPLEDRGVQANINGLPLATPEEALFMLNMVVGDSVVIWRAWVLYQRTLWVVLIPCTMLLMSLVFTIIDITCLTDIGFGVQSSVAGGGGVCAHAELISWAFSLVTNATCTLLIGYKAWHHRRSMKSLNILGSRRRMSTDKVLSILVESGFIYCLFWLTQVILFINIDPDRQTPIAYVYELFAGMGDQISGMYPTLIIVIVNLHQTIWDSPSTSDVELGTINGVVSSVQWANSGTKRSAPTGIDTLLSRRGNIGQPDGMAHKEPHSSGGISTSTRDTDGNASEHV
ncbi:hypothetical protein K438DRAFT_1844323 [Mycena galopus ATCC 62051]|nr:hypothetical protein K438DRAFT_1844323 [Mycena galopus ATCC 62051]